MPTYEYICKKCEYKFEAFQSMKDEPLKKCPKCDGSVKRMIGSGAGVIFKGTGFYQTDYKGANCSATGPSKPSDSCSKGDGCSKCSE